MKLINGRYKIIKDLQRDFCSSYYIVSDIVKNKSPLCLRLFEPEYAESSWIKYYIEQFIFLTSLEHGHMMQNYSFGLMHTIDNKEVSLRQYFYTTEYIGSITLPYIQLSKEERLECIYKICKVLKYLHFRGITYKHLNPENIKIYRSENELAVKLTDLAHITQIEYTRTRIDGCHHKFLSPEYQLGASIDATSDIYSLGVLLYYFYCGLSYTDSEFNRNRVSENEQLESEDMIMQIIKKMTAYEKVDRPKSIAEILLELNLEAIISENFKNDKNNYEKLNFKTMLVNRENELQAVLNNVDTLRYSSLKKECILIQGEYGIGKSRFIKEIIYRLGLKNINTYSSVFVEPCKTPYKPFIEIIKQMLKHANKEIIQKYGTELVKIIPSMSSVWDIKPSASLAGEKEKLRLYDRICNFINDCAATRPTVIVIDNFHYADINTMELVDFFLKQKKTIPLLFILTYRKEDNGDVLNHIYRWRSMIKTEEIQLTKFNLEETASIIQNILGMAWKPIQLATRIMHVTDGNPRYIEEVVKNLFIQRLISVNQNDLWVANVDDLYDLQLPANIDEALIHQMDAFDHNMIEVLKCISIFNTSISSSIISNMLPLYDSTLQLLLTDLVEMKILSEKLEDWGFTYDYYNRQLKNYVYSRIPDEKRIFFHRQAAKILEDNYIKESRENKDELIHHLTKCGNIQKAIDYCIQSAQKMVDLSIHSQALEFYNKVLGLYNLCDDDYRKTKVLLSMGDIYLYMGESEKALRIYEQTIQSAKSFKLMQSIVDAKNKISEVYLNKKMIYESKTTITHAMQIAEEIQYSEGSLEAYYILSNIYFIEKNMSEFKKIVESSLVKSYEYKNDHYIGHFLNQKGKLYHLYGAYDDAMMYFIQSMENFMKSDNVMDAIKPINNMGVLIIENVRDTKLARKYYKKALQMAQKYNYIVGTNIYHFNIGETYLIEDCLKKAENHFVKALQISEETEDCTELFWIYLYLSEVNLKMTEYAKAYNYLLKAESEYDNEHVSHKDLIQLRLLKTNWYAAVGEMNLAKSEIGCIEGFIENADKITKFLTGYYDYQLNTYKHQNINRHTSWVHKHAEQFQDKNLTKEIRTILLEEAMHHIEVEQFEEARELLQKDETFMLQFDTNMLSIKRHYLMGYFQKDKVLYFENLLKQISSDEFMEIKWRVYQSLGNEYFRLFEYYNAVNCYINGLDIIRRLTNKVPHSFQLSYLNQDKKKLLLRKQIDNIRRIIETEDHGKQYSANTDDWRNIQDLKSYFDFSDLQSLFSNTKFLQSAMMEYQELFSKKISSIHDLIQILTLNDIENIQAILSYCVQITLAKRGFVIIVDQDNCIGNIVSLDSSQKLPDIYPLVDRVKLKQDGILIKTRFDNRADQTFDFLPSDAQAAICIPIFKNEENRYPVTEEKRKNQEILPEKIIHGYIYLDTDKIFNKFDRNAFKMCSMVTNLLSLSIENYHLKMTASIDKLTNVYMRKYFEQKFKEEILQARGNKSEFSLIMCDIDKFKSVNDLYGHRKGDEVLSRIGCIIKENLRSIDLVGRYGGEEFIILLPNTNKIDAKSVLEKVRRMIENTDLLSEKHPVTISCGISTFPEHGYFEEELIEKADQALYHAKEIGRNRTVIWDKNIANIRRKVDKLAGIISGNMAQDHRRVEVVVEIIELLKTDWDTDKKVYELLGRIIEITDSKKGALFITRNEQVEKSYARERYKDEWLEKIEINEMKMLEIIASNTGDFFIDWETIPSIDDFTGTPDWQSVMFLPIINNGKNKGILYLSVSIKEREFDSNTFNYVNAITSIIGAIL
ncbi:diguanylate cyclase [Geosporobacter ferrireducens]|uniref:Diguanylate cyclase n=1 Tax=Geosporobacter ferrireducens TaxID=1424294 RepID=A0A1D8GP13_9FIRM|nr:diguanylate cyclase [Geosporobacter ferrireducens]AOT72691.1 hypothetical protein Gferi_25925 [Geosporobacter ferrireducens]MTI55100.1 diguanylate cyclase [Geosporobacter ferrireducens]